MRISPRRWMRFNAIEFNFCEKIVCICNCFSEMVQIQTILCKGKILWNPIQYHLFLRKHFPENQSDKRSAVHQLPEESHREIHESGLQPDSNKLRAGVFEQQGCNQTHDRTHDADNHDRDSQSDNDRAILRRYHAESELVSQVINHKLSAT